MKSAWKTILALGLFLSLGLSLWGESFTCTTTVNAYDPAHPENLIGQFQSGSELEIGAAAAPGFHQVTFHTSDGQVITAVCQDSDIGMTVKKEPATESSPQKAEPPATPG